MSSDYRPAGQRLDLSRWRNVPAILMGGGGLLAVLGLLFNPLHFAYSWLLAFMFCLSLCLGALFLVLVHHLFDAGWSVPIRRFNEHIASLLFPLMFILFFPIAALAPRIYQWMNPELLQHPTHALSAKYPLFTPVAF